MRIPKTLRRLLEIASLVLLSYLTGCASVPMTSPELDAAAKEFKEPAPDMAVLYVYRNSIMGTALKKMIALDGKLLYVSAPKTFFYTQISPGKHTLSTESEFGDNTLDFEAEGGKLTFIHHYVKLGVFVGGANLEAVDEETGKEGVLECKRAVGFETAK